MEQLRKNTSLPRAYGQFLSQFDWRYFMTCRHRYKLSEKTINKWTDKLFKSSLSISRIYWVMERDKSDMSSKHVHMLLECSEEITQDRLKKILNTSVGDFDEIRSKTAVSNYVTKFISYQNVEYDFVNAKS
jgi:hypothetical protein